MTDRTKEEASPVLRMQFSAIFWAVVVTALALAVYDRTVRVPQTPRLAMVDVTALYSAVQHRATQGALKLVDRSRGEAVGDDVASAALSQVERAASEFGPRLDKALKGLADECQCVVVAMAAVHGQDAGIPNYTQLMAQRLGVELGS